MKAALRPVLELLAVFPGLLLAYFPVRSYLNQSPGRLGRAAAAPDGGGVCRRRTALPPFSVPHGGGAGGPRVGGGSGLYQNAAYFPLEIGNHRPERMRGIRLYQQHLPRRQRGAPDLRAGSMAGAVALPGARAFFTTRPAGCSRRRRTIHPPALYARWWRTTISRRRGMCSGYCP